MAKQESTTEDKIVRSGTVREKGEGPLTDHEIVQRRTARISGMPEWPVDGRFRRVFHIQVARVSNRHSQDDATSDWNAPEYDSMHEANKVATLQDAMSNGLHPRAEARFDGAEGEPDELSGTASLVYSVECVPASSEAPEEAALAYTPSAALNDLGGTTLVEAGQGDAKPSKPERVTKADLDKGQATTK